MKEFTGTKGQWLIDDEEENGVFIKTESGDGAICRVYTNNRVIKGLEGNENAKLIAASPDLLQAAIDFVNKVDKGRARSTDSYNKFKAAIRKALG